MKPKEVRKKLTLKKQTIINLEVKQQDAIRGGIESYNSICWKATICATVCANTCCGSDPCSC
jgi:hypothetical protein